MVAGHSTIRAILINEKYAGVWRWNTTKWVRIPGKRARKQLERPESEHVVREYLDLAIIDRVTWDRVQAKFEARKPSGTHGDTLRKNQRIYLLSGLLKCGVCGGPMSVSGQQVRKGVRYASFGCTTHSSRGAAVCANNRTVSEKKLNSAFIDHMKHVVLWSPNVIKQLRKELASRTGAKITTATSDLEKRLKAAEARVHNATVLMVEMPVDLDLRRQRAADQKEVIALNAELEAQTKATGVSPPTEQEISKLAGQLLAAITDESPERARAVLAKAMSPLKITPKIEGPDHLVEVSGSLDLSNNFAVSGSSRGVISRANTWQTFRISLEVVQIREP